LIRLTTVLLLLQPLRWCSGSD